MTAIPEGFELESAPGGPPPLPPGFELEGEMPVADEPAVEEEPTADWRDVLSSIPGEIKRAAAQLIAGQRLLQAETPRRGLPAEAERLGLAEPVPDRAQRVADELAVLEEIRREDVEQEVPNMTAVQRGVQAAGPSLVVGAPALALGIATRNPALTAASLYPSTEGSAYGQLRSEGVEPELARPHAAFQGAVEAGTELLPFAQLLKGLPVGQTLIRTLAAELPGESIAQLAQGGSDYVARAQAEGRELTPELALEGLATAAEALPETWVATLITTTLQTGGVGLTNRAARGERERREQRAFLRQEPTVEAEPLPPGFEVDDTVPPETPPAEPPVETPPPVEPPPAEPEPAPPVVEPPEPTQPAPTAAAPPVPAGFEVVDEEPTVELPPMSLDEAVRDKEIDEPIADELLPALRERFAQDAAVQQAVREIADTAGWDTVGGKRLGTDETRGGVREIQGRTKWLPKAAWFASSRRAGYSPQQVKLVVEKAIAGERLGPRQQGLIDFLSELAVQSVGIRQRLADIEAKDLVDFGLEDAPENADTVDLGTRARQLDEDAFERIVIKYEGDEAGYVAAIKELIARHEQGAAVGRGEPPLAGEEAVQAGRVPDLFGQDVAQQAALNRRNRILERRRGIGRETPPPEAAPPGDLFRTATERERAAAAAAQTDIEDETPQAMRVQRQAGAAYVPLIQTAGAPTAAANTFTLGLRGQPQRTIVIPAKPIRRESAMQAIERGFGVKIFQGRPFRVRKALGFYRPKTGEVRVKAHHDLEVTAHEFFHWLDRRHSEIRKLYHDPQYRDELKSVSYDQKLLFEGFAEFGRLYLTQESQAAARAPKFYDAFVHTVQRLGLLKKMHRAQDIMHAWYLQGAEARALSKIGPPDRNFREWWEANTNGLTDREIQRAFDWLHSFKVVERTVTGGVQDATISPYGAARLMAGARGTVKAVLNHGTIGIGANGDIVFTGPGLKQVFDPVADAFDATMAYFVGQRAQELKEQGREKLLAQDEIDALLAIAQRSPKYTEIQQAFRDYQAFQDRMMDFYIQTGLTSREKAAAMREANKSYVPFNRILETLEQGDKGAPRGRFMRLKGGTQNLRDTWENIVGNVNALVASGLRNHAKAMLYGTIESNRAGQAFAVRVATEQHGTLVQPLRILQQLAPKLGASAGPQAQQGMTDLLDAIGKKPELAEAILYWSGKYQPSAPDIDMVLVNGEPRYYQIGDPLLMETLQLWNTPRPTNLGLRILGGFAGTLRRGVTFTFDFLVPNLIRDTGNAFALSKGGQVPFLGSLRGMVKTLVKDKDYWDFYANGGGFASIQHGEAQVLRKRMERYYVDRKIDYRTVLDTPQKLLDALDDIFASFEYGTRLAEFRALRAKGATAREATLAARDISTDFGMRGSSELLRWVTTGVPFMNARMQGLYRIQREVAEKDGRVRFNAKQTGRFALRALIGLTLPSMLLWWRNHEDERYKALPDWIKLTHWVIVGIDKVYLIPKPFEVGAAFATIPEQTLEYIKDRDGTEYAEAIAFLAAQAFNLDPTPQLVKPLVDLARNKTFTGKPIVPEGLKDVAPQEQFSAYTSETAIQLGQKLGVSPVKLDHLARGYFGTLGAYALSVSDALIDPTLATGPRPASKSSEFYVLRRFVRESPIRGTQQEQDFYEILDASREVAATFNKIKQDTRARDAETYVKAQERPTLYGARGSLELVASQAATIRSAMRKVRLSEDLTADEKREQLDVLQFKLNSLFDTATLQLRRQGITAKTGTED